MEVESIKGSAVMPYQGSAAVPAAKETGSAPEAEQTMRPTKQASEYSGAAQDYSYGAEGTEDAGEQKTGQLKKAVTDLNKQLKNSEAIFGIHEETNRVTIKIVDKSTKEVIKEFPPEETLDMIAKVWEIAGIRVDQKL